MRNGAPSGAEISNGSRAGAGRVRNEGFAGAGIQNDNWAGAGRGSEQDGEFEWVGERFGVAVRAGRGP